MVQQVSLGLVLGTLGVRDPEWLFQTIYYPKHTKKEHLTSLN